MHADLPTDTVRFGYSSSTPPAGLMRLLDHSRRDTVVIRERAVGAWIAAACCIGPGIFWAWLLDWFWWFPAGPLLALGALLALLAVTSMSRIRIEIGRRRVVPRGGPYRGILVGEKSIAFSEVEAVQLIEAGTIGTGTRSNPKQDLRGFQINLVLPSGRIRTSRFRTDSRRLSLVRTTGEDRVARVAAALADAIGCPLVDQRPPATEAS